VDRGVVLNARGAVALEEIVVDEPAPGEVAVRIEASGVCHTGLHVVEEDAWGHRLPVLLGHEGAGTVERVGAGVTHVARGDRVVLGWHTACGECVMCARGLPRQCKRPPAAAGRLHRGDGSMLTPVLRTGTFATRTVVPSAAAVKVPAELPVEQASAAAPSGSRSCRELALRARRRSERSTSTSASKSRRSGSARHTRGRPRSTSRSTSLAAERRSSWR
jgi:Zn-dependent alcohol dehydrogenase